MSLVVLMPTQIIKDCARHYLQLAQSKRLDLKYAWLNTIERHYWADSNRVKQMLLNLIDNAIKFTPSGSVRIEACEIECNGDSAILEFAVTDTGIGIPADKQQLLFKPFSQLDSSTTREYGGTGLGLSIVNRLAQLMDGNAGVESQAGHGSRFWFRIRVHVLQKGE
jgi:signal transduction histidine kinase